MPRERAPALPPRRLAMCGNVATTQDQVADRVADILKASKLDPAKVSAITPTLCDCGTPSCGTPVACATVTAGKAQVCVQTNVLLNASTSTPPACGVAVSFRYPYQFWFPFTSLNKQLVQLRAQAEAIGEN